MQTSKFSRPWVLTSIRNAAALGTIAVLPHFCLAAQSDGSSELSEAARMSPELALRVLLGDAAPSLPRSAAQVAETFAIPSHAELPTPTSSLKVVVKRGDTVESLLRRHLGGSAFSMQFQRQALVRLNPSAFQKGLVQRLEIGTTLWMPTDPIMAGMVPGGRKDGPLTQATSTATDPSGTAGQPMHSPSPTRGWVRFP